MPTNDLTGHYSVDVRRSRIGFSARHAVITKVRGFFADFAGSAELDFGDPVKSSAAVTIQTVSIDTGNGARDEQLRTNDFLDPPTYPTITFRSTSVDQIDGTRFDVTGDLTIKATTRPVTIRFTRKSPATATREVTFTGSATINRRDWNVAWAAPLEAGGVLVGDTIGLEIDVTAIQVEAS